jgi:phospholipid/cholesterol/gamma-HCH transport system substrate-binding protein
LFNLKISREFKIGIFFVIAIAALVWGFSFLKGKDFFTRERKFYSVYENIGGLTVSNPVYINGLKVGHISDLRFDESMSGDIILEMTILSEFPIPKNTISRIISEDLLGSKAVNLILGDSPEMAVTGDTLASSLEASLKEEVNAQILPIKLKAEELISSIDSMVVAIKGVFSKDISSEILASIQSIRATFQNLEHTTSNVDTLVAEQSRRIASILYNLDMITRNFRENEGQINSIIDNLAQVSDSLSHANIPATFLRLNEVVTDLSAITSKIQKGEGSMGLLMNDDKLYNNLESVTFELNQLINDIRVNPKKYVRFSVF